MFIFAFNLQSLIDRFCKSDAKGCVYYKDIRCVPPFIIITHKSADLVSLLTLKVNVNENVIRKSCLLKLQHLVKLNPVKNSSMPKMSHQKVGKFQYECA